jgi:hypothetical protein
MPSSGMSLRSGQGQVCGCCYTVAFESNAADDGPTFLAAARERGARMSQKCPICYVETLTTEQHREDATYCECPRCVRYALTGTAKAVLASSASFDKIARAKLSHSVNRMASGGQWPKLSSDLIQSILKDPTALPLPSEQLDNLIAWLGKAQPDPGSRAQPTSSAIAAVGALDENGLGYIASQAVDQGLIDGNVNRASYLDGRDLYGLTPLQLTISGWDRFETLRQRYSKARIAFMAMPFGIAELDQLYHDHFYKAVGATGFTLKRLDENQPAGLIDDRLRVEIRQCRFLIADLTHGNAGAYWESGYAEGLGKPVIYTCEKSAFDDRKTGPHFDTNHHLTVVWDARSLDGAMNKLKATIRATLPDEAIFSD